MDLGLKELLPFGTTLFGAITGGLITYRLSKLKEKKEAEEKRLESLFELQRIHFKLIRSFTDLQLHLEIYISVLEESEKNSVEVVTNKIIDCSDELMDSRVLSLGKAVHISEEVFEVINTKHDEIRFAFYEITVANENNVNGMKKVYSERNLTALKIAFNHIATLQEYLMKTEKKYSEMYIKRRLKN